MATSHNRYSGMQMKGTNTTFKTIICKVAKHRTLYNIPDIFSVGCKKSKGKLAVSEPHFCS